MTSTALVGCSDHKEFLEFSLIIVLILSLSVTRFKATVHNLAH